MKERSLHFCNLLFKLFIATIVFITFPLLIPPGILIYLIRVTVAKAAQLFKPSLGKMVPTLGALFATDEIYTAPMNNVLLTCFVEEFVEVDRLEAIYNKTILGAKFPNGMLKYPEITQTLTSWSGFYFFEKCPHFNLQNHLNIYKTSKTIITEDDLRDIQTEMIQKPWIKGRPLWEVMVVHNYLSKSSTKPQSVLLMRMQHSLADGYSLMFLVYRTVLGQTDINTVIPNFIQRNFWSNLVYMIQFPFRLCFTIAEFFLTDLNSPFGLKPGMRTGVYYLNNSERIPISSIKKIKDHFGVSFVSVLFGALSGALREILIKKGTKLPETTLCNVPFPLPGHTEKLRNQISFAMIKLPVGTSDCVERMKLCQQDYERLKESILPVFFTLMSTALCSTFNWMIPYLVSIKTPLASSVFPGGNDPIVFDDGNYTCFEGLYHSHLHQGDSGMMISFLSFSGGIRMGVTAEGAIMSKEEVKDLVSLVEKQIDEMLRLIV